VARPHDINPATVVDLGRFTDFDAGERALVALCGAVNEMVAPAENERQ
jgi:hypothetical protein